MHNSLNHTKTLVPGLYSAFQGLYRQQASQAWKTEDLNELVNGLKSGDRLSLSRAITLFESTRQDHKFLAAALLRKLEADVEHIDEGKRAFRIGVSGPPGAGKSCLIEALGCQMVAAHQKVAVLAIDPSSKFSGGAILGDKTRMPRLSASLDAYVRPTPARGTLGGVARATSDAIMACETGNYKRILVETVGVGQSETSVEDLVDCFILVVPPVGGDELQVIKRGITELADIIVVNKADGNLEVAAARAAMSFQGTMHFHRSRRRTWVPKALACSAQTGFGIESLRQLIEKFKNEVLISGELHEFRRKQRQSLAWTTLEESLLEEVRASPHVKDVLNRLRPDIMNGTISPRTASEILSSCFNDYH